MPQRLLGLDRGMETAHDHGNAAPPELIGDLVGPEDVVGDRGQRDEVDPLFEIDVSSRISWRHDDLDIRAA